jgi:hypothetical protein
LASILVQQALSDVRTAGEADRAVRRHHRPGRS